MITWHKHDGLQAQQASELIDYMIETLNGVH
ncbi:hypothetical protein LTAR_00067 [Leptolinea tardivitalis]|nr:hypothetical protein LTAR_00067 [Leptolinea tardivitalis]